MIRSFRDRKSEALFGGARVKEYRPFRRQAERRLQMLDDATSLAALAGIPGNRLEALRGERQGRYSIRINAQWRLCFRWGDKGPDDVEITDYH